MKSTLLKPLYRQAVQGVPLLGTPEEVAAQFARSAGSLDERSDRLIAFYVGLCGATGFVCGLPGYLLLPVTLPANLAGVALLQLHMSAALAALGGRDLEDPATRDRCIACLLEKFSEQGRNSEEEEVLSRAGIKLAERGVRLLAEQTAKVTFRGARRLPLVGGILGAGSDAYATAHVGRCVKHALLSEG